MRNPFNSIALSLPLFQLGQLDVVSSHPHQQLAIRAPHACCAGPFAHSAARLNGLARLPLLPIAGGHDCTVRILLRADDRPRPAES